jgi:hypothetical protein
MSVFPAQGILDSTSVLAETCGYGTESTSSVLASSKRDSVPGVELWARRVFLSEGISSQERGRNLHSTERRTGAIRTGPSGGRDGAGDFAGLQHGSEIRSHWRRRSAERGLRTPSGAGTHSFFFLQGPRSLREQGYGEKRAT